MSGEMLPGPLVREEYMSYVGAVNGEALAGLVGFPAATATTAALAESARLPSR